MAIAAERVGLLILAAGRSERFGGKSKLVHMLGGVPLGLHLAQTLEPIGFACRCAVIGKDAPDFASLAFATIKTDRPEAGLSYSLSLGVKAVQTRNVDAIMLALADMPFVSLNHVESLLAAYVDEPIASASGERRMPPVIFPRSSFATLLASEGDQGARDLIRRSKAIKANPQCLTDIDTLADLDHWTRARP